MDSDFSINTEGLLCPEPLMLVRNKIRELEAAQVLHISATDPSTHRDFVNFCRFMGHDLLRADVEGPIFEYWIQKKVN